MSKISGYPAASAITADDVLLGNDGTQTKKFPASLLMASSAGTFNVKDPTYGATGLGVVDDSTAIQAAIAAANAAGGGEVLFPAGTYLVGVAISLSGVSKVTLRGVHRTASIIKQAAAANIATGVINATTAGSNVVIRDLGVDGNRAGQSSGATTGIRFPSSTSTRVRVTGCHVFNCGARGMSITGTEFEIDHNLVTGCADAGIGLNEGADRSKVHHNSLNLNEGDGIYIGSRDNEASFNLCWDNRDTGINFGGPNDPTGWARIVGNECWLNDNSGLNTGGGDRTIITGNTCFANGRKTGTPRSNAGIRVRDTTGTDPESGLNFVANHIIVTSNHCFDDIATYPLPSGALGQLYGVEVVDATTQATTDDPDQIIIAGNDLLGNLTSAVEYVNAAPTQIRVVGNLGVSDDITATTVPFTPAGTIAATTVQAAIAEVDSELAARVAATAAGGDLTGTVANAQIAALAVGTAELAALAVTDAKVATANKDGASGTASMRTLGTGAAQAAAGDHAHAASAVTFSPTGSIAATTVQAAIAEVATEAQPLDSDLTAIAALSTTSFGRSLLAAADAAGLRTLAETGTIATQAASAVTITGGSITGITDIAVADGGTGASDASGARTNLGLAIGTDVQAYDADLASLATAGNSTVLAATTASFLTADETKLDGVAAGATANDTDANLKARGNHTGTQTASTISDFNTAASGASAGGAATVGGDLTGTVANAQIAAAAVGTAELASPLIAGTVGDAQSFYWPTEGQRLRATHGTVASPVTALGPTVKVSRIEQFTRAALEAATAVGADGGELLAAVYGVNAGTASTEVQAVGVHGAAKTGSTSGILGNDACGVYGAGRVTGVGTGTGIGGFFLGRRDDTAVDAQACGLEAHAYNGVAVDAAYSPTGFSPSHGIWVNAGGAADSAAGITVSNAFGRQFEVGLAFTGQVTNSKTGGARLTSIRDDSTSTRSLHIKGTHSGAAIAVDAGAGHVAIGHDTPTAQLHIISPASGTTSAEIRVGASQADANPALAVRDSGNTVNLLELAPTGHVRSGVTATDFPAFSSNGDTNTGLGLTGSDGATISTNAVVRQRWSNDGAQFGATLALGGGVGVVGIANATTVPTTNPSGGAVLYAQSGDLKYRSSAGTVHPIAQPVWQLHTEWTTAGTNNNVTLPANAVAAEWIVGAGSGGGGSGRRGAAGTVRCGGGGGGNGGSNRQVIRGTILTETFTVVVGAAGAGGAAVTANDTNGNAGTIGGASTVVASTSGAVVNTQPGTGGSGGTATTGTAGVSRVNYETVTNPGNASATGGTGANGSAALTVPSGAGAGGGITSADVASAGGGGGRVEGIGVADLAGGAVNTAGANGASPSSAQRQQALGFGQGGAGGGGSIVGAAGAGGNGGSPSAGGGGGGASLNGNNSGAGGAGVVGYVAVWILAPAA